MSAVLRSTTFDRWLSGLRDANAAARVQVRIDRMAAGNPGEVRSVGGGVSEMKINYGPGYRVYFMQRGQLVVVLLCGGDKSSQRRDIATARKIAAQWKEYS